MPSDASLDRRATLFVTRPAGDAHALIEALRRRKRSVVALPVLGIEPVDDASELDRTMARVGDYRLVVFVSPNAIRQALARRVGPWPPEVAIGVMGPGSVAALLTLGIAHPAHRIVSPSPVETAQSTNARFDSEALFAALDAALQLTRQFAGRVLILRGNGGRAWFADRLRDVGIAVDEVEAYRRVRPVVAPEAAAALRDLAASRSPAIFVVTSSEGVANLIALVDDAVVDGREWLLGCTVLAPHARIAEQARAWGFTRIALCAPGDAGIVAAIE